MSFRYIGSKARVADAIGDAIGKARKPGGVFVDAFCGTGVVAETASKLGWPVHLNDNLACAVTMAAARLISKEQAPFKNVGGYEAAIRKLNSLMPTPKFIWREYSPASAKAVGVERRYFTEENAARIDAIRFHIGVWKSKGLLNDLEEKLLIADLLGATNRVANIAGTYGCFLSRWTPQAANRLELRARELPKVGVPVAVSSVDVALLQTEPKDVVYLDPPYTKRQYASYYHILETITLGDCPVVEGVAGLRPWKDKASDFCYKTRALVALTSLIKRLPSRHVLLSYSNEGHVHLDDLTNSLEDVGDVSVIELKMIGRYRPNKTASEGVASVKEYLIVIERVVESQRKAFCR